MQVIAIASAALLAVAPVVRAAGSAIIHNKCDFDVYLWSVSADGAPNEPTTLSSGGDPFVQQYQIPSVGGMSLKLSNDSVMGPVSQFEYTLADNIYYDMSNIDCTTQNCPFQQHGFFAKSGTGCPTITCPASDSTCDEAYNLPDDVMTCACESSADITLYLCALSDDGSDDSTPSSSAAPSSTAEATPTTTSVVVPTSAPETTTISSSEAGATTTLSPVSTSAAGVPSTTAGAVQTTLVTRTRSWGGWGYQHTQAARAEPRHVHHARHPRARA